MANELYVERSGQGKCPKCGTEISVVFTQPTENKIRVFVSCEKCRVGTYMDVEGGGAESLVEKAVDAQKLLTELVSSYLRGELDEEGVNRC